MVVDPYSRDRLGSLEEVTYLTTIPHIVIELTGSDPCNYYYHTGRICNDSKFST